MSSNASKISAQCRSVEKNGTTRWEDFDAAPILRTLSVEQMNCFLSGDDSVLMPSCDAVSCDLLDTEAEEWLKRNRPDLEIVFDAVEDRLYVKEKHREVRGIGSRGIEAADL